MTSRLKHKLELENVNLKSAYLNESFVQIGTPLPDLASTRKDKLEYVPEWQQEVRDEKGRRRFHGAFTGGFSAGYFNTVGSKEGWAPSEFKSSRNNRANRVQRPEDFMDEEDLQQMNDDRQLENTETFRNEAFAGERRPGADAGSSALESLIAPAKSSIGQTLLQKQGWKPGQGIGPRITLRKLRIQEGKLGRRRTGLDDEDEEIEQQQGAGKHLFAPRDSRLVVYRTKDDKEGLGYEKGRGMGRIPPKETIASLHRPTNDPDEDMYEAGPSAALAFAFDQNADDEVITMGGPSNRHQRTQPGDYAQSGDRWHDGRPVLPGFALDPLGVPTDKWFDMPEIPSDWRPRPARVWGTGKKWGETPDAKVEAKPVVRGAPGLPLTFEQRGAALGEVAPPQAAMVEEAKVSQAKSVFEYMSEKDRERLAAFAAAAKGLSAPPPALAKDEAPEQPQAPAEEIEIPPLSPRTASSALRGFVPYGDDPAKQDRYRSYLSSQTYNTTTPMPNLRTGTVEEINKELQDFAASARIFKPMSFAMSNRFTAGSSSLAATDLKQPKAGLHLYDAEKAKADMEKPKGETVAEMKHKNPREEAAAKGMYGPLTRETKTFYPEKLLCRRFGVQNPYPDGDPSKGDKAAGGGEAGAIGDLPVNDASWQDSFIHKELEVPATTPTAPTEDARPKSIAEVGMAEDSTQGRDTLTYVKPSLDIFKAIFEAGSDSEDEEEIPGPAATATAVNRIGEDPFPVKQETPVDLATFRPVFQNRKEGEGDGDKAEKKKSKKDKKKRKGVLSFEVDPEEEVAEKEFKKKKRNLAQTALDIKAKVVKEANVEPADVVEEEWVEKPVSYAKMGARKGAADFM